uniref:Caspase-8 n=2 Tax=Tetraodon nigroviridis TaxID=99883 RepID=H3BZ00_TETNG
SAYQLFLSLCDQDHLSEERPHLLSELLSIIQRTRLLRDLDLRSSATSNLISAYRKLLYSLSEDLTDDNLKEIKFLLTETLPRRKLEDNVTTLEVFLELECMDLLSKTNLGLLKSILQPVCPVLAERIRQFEAQNSCQPAADWGFAVKKITDPLQVQGGSDALPSLPEENQSSSRTEASVMSSANAVGIKPGTLMLGLSPPPVGSPNFPVQDLGTYPMTTLPRGCCLIISNYDFQGSGLGMRNGTRTDEECLKKVFEWLGFKVEIHRDCTGKEILSLMQELADKSQQRWDCLVCCILSHGLEGCVHGVDGDQVSIKKLIEPFLGTNCPAMAGKPKLFFIQACQGKKQQGVVHLESDGAEHSDVDTDAVRLSNCIPSHADFLLGMATVPDYVSYRDRERGTWYIQSLCEYLVKMVPRGFDLMSILTKVNEDVSKKNDNTGDRKQMPQPVFTITKRIVFPVPSGPAPVLPHFPFVEDSP